MCYNNNQQQKETYGNTREHNIPHHLQPDKTKGSAINTYTVDVEEDLHTAGKKTGFVGKVHERGNEYRSFRFDRILSIEKVAEPVVEEKPKPLLRRILARQ